MLFQNRNYNKLPSKLWWYSLFSDPFESFSGASSRLKYLLASIDSSCGLCVSKCPFGVCSILVTPEHQLCYLLSLIMVFKTTDKTLIGIPHIHLMHSLNPCTNEEHGTLFKSSGAVCFLLHNTLGPNLQEISQGHSFTGIRCSCLALRFEHVTRHVCQHQQI